MFIFHKKKKKKKKKKKEQQMGKKIPTMKEEFKLLLIQLLIMPSSLKNFSFFALVT